MGNRYSSRLVSIGTLLGLAIIVTPALAALANDIGDITGEHSTEWNGGKTKPKVNVFEKTTGNTGEQKVLQLGGKLLSEVYNGRVLKQAKLPNGNVGTARKQQAAPEFVAMAKAGYAGVQFEGTIGTTPYQTKNYIAKLPVLSAPEEQLERVVGYTSNNYYGCFNVANNYMVNNVNGNSTGTQIWGVSWQMLNADTWQNWGNVSPGTDNAMVMYDTAYDPTQENVVYGWMAKMPATNENTGWYKLDMTEPSFTLISQPQIEVRGVACSGTGQYYAIDAAGKFYMVDKTTGEFKEVGDTGAKSAYRTTAAFDELSGMIYYVTVNDEGSSFYRINPATGGGTKIYDFSELVQFTNLYFGARQAPDGAPGMPENVQTNFAESLSGNVEFDVPKMTYDDEPATGRVAYKVSLTWTADAATGEQQTVEYTGSAAYGDHVKEYITLPAAQRYSLKVRCSNEVGDGPWTLPVTKYLGPDSPDTPYSFKGVYEDGKWKLTWSAHSDKGTNGGDIDPMSVRYRLTFMPEGREVVTEGGATSYEEEMAEPQEFAKYYWTCQAETDLAKSPNIRQTDKIGLGTIYPYWSEDFKSYTNSNKKDALAGFKVIDLAEKHGDWAWVSPQWINHAHWRGVDENSYLVLPKVYLYGGRYYTFNFVGGKYASAYGDPEIRVVMGREATEKGLNEKVLMENTKLTKVASYPTRGEEGEKFSLSFMPEHDGVYYIAIQHCNKDDGSIKGNAGLYNLRLGGFELKSPIIPGAPSEVRNLTAEPDVDGNTSVTLSFTCPRENMAGTALMGMTRAEIKRGDLMVADVPLTGSTFKWIDGDAVLGENIYTVTPYNNEGAGNPSQVSCFVGLAAPASVVELTAVETETKGTVNLTWTPVDKDINGKNLKNVRYALVRNIGGQNEVLADDLNTTEYTDVVTNGSQMQVLYGVKAITTEGISADWAVSQTMLLGNAYPVPYIESIDGGEPSSLLIAETSSNYGRWELFYDDDLAGVESADHDNGYIGFYSQLAGEQGALHTGRITIPKELENPVFSFYYFLMPEGRNTIQALIRTDDNPQYEPLATFVAGPDGPGWQVGAIDMTPYLGRTVRITLVASVISHTYTLMDRFEIRRMADVDINNVTISAPAKASLNEEVDVTVSYMNASLKPAKGYKVILMRDGEAVAEVDGEEVGICERATVPFKDTILQTAGDIVKYEAKVLIEGDENEADNTTVNSAEVTILKPELPEATGLAGERLAETEINLEWAAPDMDTRPYETVTEGFEGLTTGATKVEGWINLDRDGHAIGFGGSSNIEFPGLVNNESPAPWLAVNTTENNCDKAHGGDVFMGACYLSDRSTNDDWLISPELSGKAQTISLWTRSYTNYYGGDRIEILYSEDSTDPNDFVQLLSYPYVPVEWTECKVDLPDGAKYFAIRCTSIYQIMLCVDDVTYSPKGADFVDMKLLGYNIWRDGKKVNTELVTEPKYKDEVPANEAYNYQITAVYDLGESGACDKVNVAAFSSVNNIVGDNARIFVKDNTIVIENAGTCAVSISHTNGRLIHKGYGDVSVPVEPAVYVVTVGSKVVKVMVK